MGRRKNPEAMYYKEMARAERELFEWAVRQTGSVKRAAELLGIDRKHMYERVKACGADTFSAKAEAKRTARAALVAAKAAEGG